MIVYQLEAWDFGDIVEHGIFSSQENACVAGAGLVTQGKARVSDLFITGWELDGESVSCDSYIELDYARRVKKAFDGSQG